MCCTLFSFRERYKEIKWLTPIPESHKITDAQVTEFVESLKPSLFVAIFSKMGSQDASMGLRNLATLRPELVIPPFLEKSVLAKWFTILNLVKR